MNLRPLHTYTLYISKLIGTDLHLFEVSVWLNAFGQSLISVFIPIMLYNVGFSIKEVVIFYLIFNFIDVPMNLVAQRIIEKRGARFAVILATCSKIVSLIFLYSLNHSWHKAFFSAAFLAIYDAFYWVGHLYIFASAAHKSKFIRNDVSFLQIFRFLGAVLAPIIGAYILIYTDQRTLVFFSTIMMLASLIPLFMMRHLKFQPENQSLRFDEFFHHPLEQINYFFEGFAALREEAEVVIWPFFVFFTFHSLKAVAYIPTLIAIASVFLIYFAGRLSLSKQIYKLVSVGGLVVALIWLVRVANINNEFLAISSVFVMSLMTIFIDIPMEVTIFARARETDELAAVTYLNLFRMLTRGLLYLFLFFMADIFGSTFYVVTGLMFVLFISSAVVSFYQRKLARIVD